MSVRIVIEIGEKKLDQIWSLLEINDVVHHVEHSPSLGHVDASNVASEDTEHGNVAATQGICQVFLGEHRRLRGDATRLANC